MPATGIAELQPVETYGATGNDNVDALFSGFGWAPDSGSNVTTVSFSFSNPDSVYHFDLATGYEMGDGFNEPTFAITELSAYAQGLFNSYAANLASFSLLDLVEVDDTATTAGTVRVAWSAKEDEDAVAWAYYPGEWAGAGDIWLVSANHNENDLDFGHTLVHELGHALGLKHSFEVDGAFPVIDSQYEGVDYTVMSYTVSARFPDAQWADLWPQTYMYFDILALQELYGVDTVTTAGADTYDFDQSERFLQTVWDYGGTDTIGASNGTTAVDIDLTPGTWSNVGTTIGYYDGAEWSYDNYSVYITPDTIIENAHGAGGDDTLQGNEAANKLTGNDGNDKLMGGAGADKLKGNDGNDYLQGGADSDVLTSGTGDDVAVGGSGNDTLWAGAGDEGDDVMAGGAGNDIIGGGAGDDLLIGGGLDDGEILQLTSTNEDAADDGNDTLFGGAGNDTLIGGGWGDSVVDNGTYDNGEAVTSGTGSDEIWAGSGDDKIIAAAGNDVLGGGVGDDTIEGGGGNDVFYGGRDAGDTGANDVLSGGDGNDIIFGGAGNDALYGGAGADDLFGGGGNDTVVGGAGNDSLWGGGGDDEFTGGAGNDIFVFAAGAGDDRVSDFSLTDDTIRLSNTTTDFTDLDSVTAASSAVSGGILIDLGGGDSLRLDGISLSDLSDITFVL